MFIRTERSVKEFIQAYPIVSTIIIINLGLWLFINFLQFPLGVQFYHWGAGRTFLISQGEYWRLFTSIFLHVDLMHVLFNSFALVLFGPALEQMLGKIKFLLAYFGAGILGNIGTQLVETSPLYGHVGASGAIYGLFGIYVFMVVFRKHLIDPTNAQIVVTIFVIGLITTFIMPNINRSGHIFGFIGGFALAPLVLTNVQAYNPWKARRRTVHRDDDISFDPNRWNKKRLPNKLKKNWLWIALGILAILGILSRLLR